MSTTYAYCYLDASGRERSSLGYRSPKVAEQAAPLDVPITRIVRWDLDLPIEFGPRCVTIFKGDPRDYLDIPGHP